MEEQDRRKVQEPPEIDTVSLSYEAGWKQLVSGKSIFSHVEDTHTTVLSYSFSLSCLLFPSMIQEGVKKR